MNSEVRKSAGSDIKRLQEMVKRLEEQNAQLKGNDYTSNRRIPNNRAMGDGNMVKVKLNLDDVPLLDLNAMVEEDEDTWQVFPTFFFYPDRLTLESQFSLSTYSRTSKGAGNLPVSKVFKTVGFLIVHNLQYSMLKA